MKSAEASVEAYASHNEAATADELRALEDGTLDPAMFRHADHVHLGFEMLGRYPFGEAVTRFSRGLRLLAAKGGRPEIYHETMTVAFLALIGERRARGRYDSWDDFRNNNGDLLQKRCLERWYDTEQLSSDLARRTFCLPQERRFPKSPFRVGGLEAAAP